MKSKRNTTLNIEWQMSKYNLSRDEAEEKIKKIKASYGNSNVQSIEWQMQRWGLTYEEAEEKIKNIREKIKKTQRNMSEFDFKSMSAKNPEHWIKKGFSEEDAKKMANKQISDMQKKAYQKKCENPEKYKDSYNTTVQYYIKRGFSEEEAKEKVKERQAVGKLENFIKRYGEEEGKKRWEERQSKWQKTLRNKSSEELERINKLKGITLENMIRKWGEIDGAERYNNWLLSREKSKFFSKASQDLFNKILNFIEDKENVKFASHNGEKIIKRFKKSYLYDFCYNNKIIEFNGDSWHANPKIYNETDKPNPFSNLSAKELQQLDKTKQEIAKSLGYDILIIWESEYKKFPHIVLNKCLIFLNKL